MTLEKFLDTWTRKKHTIILCDCKYYDDMFDLIDEISEGKNDIDMVCPYAYGAIIGGFGDFRETVLLNETIMNAEVEDFFIYKDTVIIWINKRRDHTHDNQRS